MTLHCGLISKSTCRSMLQRSIPTPFAVRCLTTSIAANTIPPESPRFIDIPQPPQQQEHRKPIVKGILPVPRQIFRQDSQRKVTKEYLATVTPEPTNRRKGVPNDPSTKAYVEWKDQASAIRKKNLREGLVELRKRKTRIDKRIVARTAEKQAQYEQAVHRPEREDERLTAPTVTSNTMPAVLAHIPDPNREERLALKKERVAAREQEKREERRNALHSLYMNARSFIVTEEELNAEVDRVFDNPTLMGRSMWDTGFPDSIKGLLSTANKNSNNALIHASGHVPVTKERVKRIAEELTGGKMD